MHRILPILLLFAPLAAVAEEPHLSTALASQLKLVEQQPQNPQALNDLANLLQLAMEFDEAEAAYRQALGISPEYISARYNLGLLLQRTGRPRAAARELKRVVKNDPTHARAHYQLGVALANRHNTSRAVHHYARAFVLEPDLRLPKVNPHIIENKLATRAIVLAHQQRFTPADAAPQDYSDPARIAELLLPTAPLAAAAPQDPADMEEAADSQPEAAPGEEDAPPTDG